MNKTNKTVAVVVGGKIIAHGVLKTRKFGAYRARDAGSEKVVMVGGFIGAFENDGRWYTDAGLAGDVDLETECTIVKVTTVQTVDIDAFLAG